MNIYYFVIFICLFTYPILTPCNAAFTSYSKNNLRAGTHTKTHMLYYIIVATTMIVTIGFRDLSIGIDTKNYYQAYQRHTDIPWSFLFGSDLIEPGYAFIQILFNKLGLSFTTFLTCMAIFYIGSVSFIIRKYSKSPWMSFFLFISFGYFTFSMSTIRQTIAMSFALLAFEQMQNKRLFPFVLAVLAAMSVHVSAAVFLPVYFINKLKISRKAILSLCVAALIVFIFKNQIRDIFNSYARISYGEMETGGNMMYVFMAGTLIISLLFAGTFNVKNASDVPFFYIMMLGVIIFPVTQFNPAVMRLYFYFSIFMIIYIPNMLHSIKDPIARVIGKFSYIIVSVYFLTVHVLDSTKQLIPYLFFWNN